MERKVNLSSRIVGSSQQTSRRCILFVAGKFSHVLIFKSI